MTVFDMQYMVPSQPTHTVRDQPTHGMERIAMAFWEVMMGLRAPFTLEMAPGYTFVFKPWWERL